MKQFIKKWYKKWALSLFVTIPLTFVLFFFGLLPPRYDVVVYTDNIVGEGSCATYLADTHNNFFYLYEAGANLTPELKTLRIPGLSYNVDTVILSMYGVKQLDLLSYDIAIFGVTVSHVNKDGLTHPYTVSRHSAFASEEDVLVHFEMPESTDIMEASFTGNSLIPTWIWIAYFALLIMIAVLLALGLAIFLDRTPMLRIPLLGISCLLLAMSFGCTICDSLPYVNYTYFLLNWLLFFAAALLINSLTLPWIGTTSVSVFTLLWYIANYYVIKFRNKPIMPADLKALKTAREVVGGYDLTPSWAIVIGVLALALWLTVFILAYRRFRPKEKPPLKKRLILRGIGAVCAILLMYFGVNNSLFENLNGFKWDAIVLNSFHREGILLSYIKNVTDTRISAPEGYSRELVNSYLAEYQPESDNGTVHPTRIIMVMDEAFADLRVVGLDPSIDVMPFIDSLDENTVEGSLYVSIIGGGTCNTEFEGLTGNTLAFLGTGSYPYTDYVTDYLFSLASYFRDSGYSTEAFHASSASNWSRDTAYPYLGFETFHSIEDYPDFEDGDIVHAYVADAKDFAYLEQREAEQSGSPRFLFNVTIQNHADYDHFQGVPLAETLEPFKDSLDQTAQVYLSLIKISDDSVRQLVEHYQNSDEPTMIVFFGDHEPHLSDEGFDQVFTGMSKYLDFFRSKFFIWTNYETETIHGAELSANYLPWLILERGNFPLPPYVQLLKEVHEKYPVLSSQGVIDADGYIYDSVELLMDDPLLQKYRYVQYANMFDELDPAWFQVNH